MTGALQPPKGLVDAIVEGVRKSMVPELRLELDRIITPADAPLVLFDTERDLVGAILGQRVTHDDLPPVEGKQFGVGVYGALWDAARETLDAVSLAMLTTDRGYPWAAATIAEVTLLPCEPGPSVIELAQGAIRVREYWARRVLHRELVACARLLAAEGITVEGVFDRLRPVAKEVRP